MNTAHVCVSTSYIFLAVPASIACNYNYGTAGRLETCKRIETGTLFRHVMFLAALGITSWRIGKLNFSIYEKLHNAIMDLLPRNWAEHLGHSATLQQEIVLSKQHLEDWFRYVQHNIDTGRRDACICVFHLRFAAKSHVLALSVLTLLTLPLLNKVLEYYGRHVVNDRLLGPDAGAFLNQMERTCAASEE